jgi:hypothetical protein
MCVSLDVKSLMFVSRADRNWPIRASRQLKHRTFGSGPELDFSGMYARFPQLAS